jgi:hypothetical protein
MASRDELAGFLYKSGVLINLISAFSLSLLFPSLYLTNDRNEMADTEEKKIVQEEKVGIGIDGWMIGK